MTRQFATFAKSFLLVAWLLSSFSVHAQDGLTELDQIYSNVTMNEDVNRLSDWHGLLAIGAVAMQQPPGDHRSFLVPLVSISYRDTAYWQVARGGVWLLKSDDRTARAGLTVKLRRGIDPADFQGLAGMEKRDNSIEAGINGAWTTQAVVVRAAYYTDASGKSNGDSASLGLSHPFRLDDRWSVIPSAGLEWLSAKVVDYYYGVRSSEATPSRPAYEGRGTVNPRVGVMAHYKVARDWLLFGGASYTRLGSGIADSPIIVHDDVAALYVGGGWHF